MTTLTPEQRQEIRKAGEEPVRLADPETQTEYVILKADVRGRIRAWTDDTRAAYPLATRVFGRDGWDDPSMDDYNVLDPVDEAECIRAIFYASWDRSRPRPWTGSMND